MDNELLKIAMDDNDIWDVLGRLEHFEMDQLPFALSQSLFSVAEDARKQIRQLAHKIFTIRQAKPWAELALTFYPKTRKQLRDQIKCGGEASISIISKDEVLGPLLTDGGIKKFGIGRGGRASKEFGVPIIGGARKNKMTVIRPGKNDPDVLMKKENRGIVITANDGRRLLVVYPKKYKKGVPKAQQHRAMFHMRKQVNIKPWWNARDILLAEMNRQLPTRFEEQCNRAMKTRFAGYSP